MQVDSIITAMKKKGATLEGGLVCDEIEVRPGLSYLTREGVVIGTVDAPIIEKDVSKVGFRDCSTTISIFNIASRSHRHRLTWQKLAV